MKFVGEDEAGARTRLGENAIVVVQQRVGAGNHMAESAEIFFGEPALHGGEYAGDLAATAQHLGVVENILGFRDAGDGNFPTLEALDVLGVFFRRDQFIVTAADEIQQVVQELGNIGGADVMFQAQFADAAAQVDPEILVVEDAEIFVDALKQVKAVVVEGGGIHLFAAEKFADAVAHFVGRISRVSKGEDLVGVGVALAHQTLDAVSENRSLACAGARNHEHGSVDVLDGFALALVGNKGRRAANRFRRRH